MRVFDFEVHELVDGWVGQASSFEEACEIRDQIYADADDGLLDFKPEVKITATVEED